MRAIGAAPETDLTAVADGDFSGMATPLLVAAGSRSQFDEFVWEEALMCSEVRRFREVSHHRKHPEGKILLLLPGYHADAQTAAAVEWWVNGEDRYTVQLNGPRPCIERDERETRRALWLMALAAAAAVMWVIWNR